MIWLSRNNLFRIKPILTIIILFLTPFLQYLYIPIAYAKNTIVNFGSVGSLQEFIYYITQRDYAFKIGARGSSDISPFLDESIRILTNEYTIIFFLVGVVGLIFLLKKERKMFLLLSAMVIGNLILMFWYGLSEDLSLLFRYLYPSYIIFIIFIAYGISWIHDKLKHRYYKILLYGVIAVGILAMFRGHFAYANKSENYIVGDFARNLLQTVDENSILISEGDAITGPLWYLQSIGRREDVIIVDANILGLDWYVENMNKRYPDIVDKELTNVRGTDGDSHKSKRLIELINKNLYNRKIYLATGANKTLAREFDIFPIGVVYRVLPKGDLNIEELLSESNKQWGTYTMRNVEKNQNYGFQINAIINFYGIMFNNLGVHYFLNNQPEEAIRYFEKAVSIYPTYVSAKDNLDSVKKYINE